MAVALAITACGTRESGADVPIGTARPPTTSNTEIVDAGPQLRPAGDSTTVGVGTTTSPTTAAPSTTTTAPPTTTIKPATTTSTPTTSPATTTTVPPTLPAPSTPPSDAGTLTFAATRAAYDRLAAENAGASVTIVRGGKTEFSAAAGVTISGDPATSDSPMVVASVSKILVALGIARLQDQGLVDVGAPVPWADLGLTPDPGWGDVTVRELLDHTSGLPKARSSWFTGEGTCRDFIPQLLDSPPNGDRGRWVYSNGNYCLLGLLVEARTERALDVALQQLVLDPVGVAGIHLTTDGLLPGDLPHVEGVERLSRLGGAGTLVVSTDDSAAVLGRLTPTDRNVLLPPGVFTDQYGFGHTGTVDGAKACVWVLEDGATAVAATISGNSAGTGGAICDAIVRAVASDLGIGAGRPNRIP